MTTLSGSPRRLSSSQSCFTVSDQGWDLLDLVEDEDRAFPAPLHGGEPGGLPLGHDPRPIAAGRFVGTRVANGDVEIGCDLLNEGRLPDLPRAGHDLDEAPGLREPAGELGGLRAPVGGQNAHDVE